VSTEPATAFQNSRAPRGKSCSACLSHESRRSILSPASPRKTNIAHGLVVARGCQRPSSLQTRGDVEARLPSGLPQRAAASMPAEGALAPRKGSEQGSNVCLLLMARSFKSIRHKTSVSCNQAPPCNLAPLSARTNLHSVFFLRSLKYTAFKSLGRDDPAYPSKGTYSWASTRGAYASVCKSQLPLSRIHATPQMSQYPLPTARIPWDPTHCMNSNSRCGYDHRSARDEGPLPSKGPDALKHRSQTPCSSQH